jgi:hypothetical protein
MAKKSFRVQETKAPSYPRLVELQPGALRRWGLAAVGGLLIGGGACKRQELSGVMVRTDVERGVQVRAAAVDSGGPTAPLPPPGEPPAARVEPAAGDETGKTPDAKDTADPKKVNKRRPPPRLPGVKPKDRF